MSQDENGSAGAREEPVARSVTDSASRLDGEAVAVGRPDPEDDRNADATSTSGGGRSPDGPLTTSLLGDPVAADAQSTTAALPFPVVGVGASAGGVEALRRFFEAAGSSVGAAFVVVLHLDPNHASRLAELLQPCTSMPVLQAADDMAVQVDHVYVNPPGHYTTLRGGRLRLEAILERPPVPMTIDTFLRSLARDQMERAICVILTGLDSDGAAGLKEIKAEGGLAIAQAPETAAHPSMPLSAKGTGLVDHVLPIERMPAVLSAFIEHAQLGEPGHGQYAAQGDNGESLAEVLELLRLRTRMDFRHYKKGMLLRRVRRRMGLCSVRELDAYVRRLREHPDEARALTDDFLIGVTAFFREPDAWHALETQLLPALVNSKPMDSTLRAWVPACSTGEEAYTLAMLLIEQLDETQRGLRAYVFATDVDRAALEFARAGLYPDAIAASIAPERLRRFFARTDGGWQVRKELREVVVFAPQNLIADPPFSRLDIVSCRNLMIYLESDLQRRLIQMFHFGLNPGGLLVLGKSENIGQQQALFQPALSAPLRIYRSVGPTRQRPLDMSIPDEPPSRAPTARPAARAAGARPIGYGDITRHALLELHVPAAVLVNRDHQALYFHGPTDAYLRPPRGEPSSDLLMLVREPLRQRVRAALTGALVEGRRTEVKAPPAAGELPLPVSIVATPLEGRSREGLALVTFQRASAKASAAPGADSAQPALVGQLEQELKDVRRELNAAIEELETANEELKVSNEEALSMNEELQSTNEELETSKEELQSVNEELTTVNTQLESKVDELESINDALANLLTSSHVPTLFLDRRFHIKRFTPTVTRLFRMIATDLDRPITDISSRVDTDALLEDARQVLATLSPCEREVTTDDGEHYLRRTLPYRTQDDRIDGVVITFTDITEIKRASEGLRKLATVLRLSGDAIIVQDLDGRITSWNVGAAAMYGYTEADALRMNIERLLPEDVRAEHASMLARARSGELVQSHETRRVTSSGRVIDVQMTLSVLEDDAGRPVAVATIERDVTERRVAERELREREARFRTLADSAPVIIWMTDALGRVEFVNRHYLELTGRRPERLLGGPWHELMHGDDQSAAAHAFRDAIERRARFEGAWRLQCADGEVRWTSVVGVPRAAKDGPPQGYVGITVDIQQHRAAEARLREADQRKDEFLAMLGHELRNPLVPMRNAVEVLRLVDVTDPRVVWVRDMLGRQTEHLTRLVDDLLDVAWLSRGVITLHREPVELSGVLRRAVEAIEPRLRQRRQRLETMPAPTPLWVEGDPVRLVQMIDNLLTNASKYGGDDKAIRVETATERGMAVLRVIDQGMGIAPEVLSKVFDLFAQDPRALDRSQGGLGIGLALVRQLADLHGGSIEASSPGVGQGAEFVLRLPLIEPIQPAADARVAPDGSVVGRVLIVDDDRDVAESTSLVLEIQGYETRRAFDSASAVAAVREFKPEVVLMDIGLPGEDGYELARRLGMLDGIAAPAIIAVSGFGQRSDLDRSRRAGFAAHLVKPVDPARLHEALAEVLGKAKP